MDISLTNPQKIAAPVSLTQRLARAVLRLAGWQAVGRYPDLPKFVLVGAPHTTNWDFPLTMLYMFATGVRFNWMAKDSIFKGPWGGFFKRLGGIPVDRSRKTNFTQQVIDAFNRSERLVIAISPEGTRRRVERWKTGFYYMARGARVPLVLGFVDYHKKQIGIGGVLHPSEDIHETFEHLRHFYADKIGKFPHQQGSIEPA